MARTTSRSVSTKYGYRRVPRMFGKGTKTKFVKLSKETKTTKTRVPKKVSSQQLAAGIKDDKMRLEGLKAIEKSKDIRTGVVTTATNASQAIAGLSAPKFAEGAKPSNSGNGANLSELVSGGISETGTSRDEDETEGSSEVM